MLIGLGSGRWRGGDATAVLGSVVADIGPRRRVLVARSRPRVGLDCAVERAHGQCLGIRAVRFSERGERESGRRAVAGRRRRLDPVQQPGRLPWLHGVREDLR